MIQQKRARQRHALKPGDAVPESGVYEVTHEDCPSEPSQLIFIAGHEFPACRNCGPRVRFQLIRATPHIFEDSDFRK